ncbi:MAG: hypothetical protein K2N56_09910, partial [Oscillospiraceae bacterium]|nr:hypothetical protein [Oscillospiraceae bacterium]
MKKRLSMAAALILLLSVTGCSAGESALNNAAGGYVGTDIGGRPSGAAAKGDADGGMFGMAPEAADADMATGGAVAAPSAAAPGVLITDPDDSPQIPPQAGLLTGGEWNDNAHWADWKALYTSHSDWEGYKSDWRIKAVNRLAVKVQNEKGEPIEGAEVTVSNWMKAVTDNKGMAYLFGEGCPMSLNVSGAGGQSVDKSWDW